MHGGAAAAVYAGRDDDALGAPDLVVAAEMDAHGAAVSVFAAPILIWAMCLVVMLVFGGLH